MFRALKRNARLALKGSWTTAVLITLTIILVMSVFVVLEQTALRLFVIDPLQANPTMDPTAMSHGEFLRYLFTYAPVEIGMSAGFALLSVLLLAPLNLGIVYWHFRLVREKRPGYSDCFYFFENARRYWRSVWYSVLLSFKTLLWGIPFFLLPGGLLGVSLYYYTLGDELTKNQLAAATMGASLSVALFVLAAVLFSIFINRYLLSAYLLCEGGDLTARQAIRESVRRSQGYRASFFLFRLSFFAWFLLLPFTLGLIMLFLMPFMSAGEAIYARYILEKSRSAEDSEEQTREFNPAQEAAATGEGQAAKAEEAHRPAVASPRENPAPPPAAPGRVPPPWEADQPGRRPDTPAPTAIPWPREEPAAPGGSAPAPSPRPLQQPPAPGPDVRSPGDSKPPEGTL